jgi:hypothetical protein
MSLLVKIAKAGCVLAILIVVAIIAAFWWAGVTPGRPRSLPADAVFLWAPYRGIPKAIKGVWLNCRQDAKGRDRCRVSKEDGTLMYEDEFIPYGQAAPVPASGLKIDPERSREYMLGVRGGFAPLVYLTGGHVLIPASRYEEGARQVRLNSTP